MKKVKFSAALALVVGNIIGVGIFTTSGVLASHVVSPRWLLLAWLIGGWYAFSGGMVYAFLARRMPYKGGDYAYLKRYFHPYWSYLFGWSALVITYSGSVAALAIGAAYYLNAFLPELHLPASPVGLNLTALALITLFTYMNHRSLSGAAKAQLLFSLLIVAMLVFFILAGGGAVKAPQLNTYGQTQSVFEFFKALPFVLFTYMGWTVVVYIADEIKQPERNIPLSIGLGVALVTMLYVGLNLVFVSAVPLEQLAGKIDVASYVARVLWGNSVGRLIALMIFTAILSSLNSTILSGPHIYKAMADDGFLLKQMGEQHPRYQTPSFALWIQAGWAAILLFSGTFEQLLTMVVGAILLFSLLAGAMALWILITEKTVKNKGLYWFSALSYLTLCVLIFINILLSQPVKSIIGFIILFLSYPFYRLQRGQTNR